MNNAIARVSRGVTGISRIGKLSLGQARPMSRSDKCRLLRRLPRKCGKLELVMTSVSRVFVLEKSHLPRTFLLLEDAKCFLMLIYFSLLG